MSNQQMSDKQRERQLNRHRDGTYAEGSVGVAGGESDISLEQEPDWGEVQSVPKEDQYLNGWGRVNHIYHPAPGVIFASCEGHGGFKLSRERNAVIPKPLRRTWYEEDAESYIVGAFHPDAMHGDESPEEKQAAAVAGVKNWFPHEWMEATGEQLGPDDSYILKQEAEKAAKERALDEMRAANPDRPVVRTEHGLVEGTDGWVAVQSEDRKRTWMVPADSLGVSNMNPLPDGAVEVSDLMVVEQTPEVRHQLDVNTDHLSEKDRWDAEEELDRLYRFDGQIMSFRQRLEEQGVTGRKKVARQRGVDYYIETDGGYVYPVKRATFEAVDLPDNTSSTFDLDNEERLADAAYERALNNRSSKAQVEKARARQSAARQASREAHDAKYEKARQDRAERMDSIRARVAGQG